MADWLVCATHNRWLLDGGHNCATAPIGQTEFALPARPGVLARTVHQQLWTRCVELPAGKGKSVNATCIAAREYDTPAGVTPIEWRLLTNRTADTAAAVAELIDRYRARWEIETLFDVLKNAYRIEALQLGAIEHIECDLALYLVVAWRIAHLRRLGRTCPDLGATLFFDPDEIEAVYLPREIHRLQCRVSTKCCGRSPSSVASWLGKAMANRASKQFGLG